MQKGCNIFLGDAIVRSYQLTETKKMNGQNKVYFMNNGTFDLRCMLTMGLSVKSDNTAIGFFGTGFKYAVAIILRNLGQIKITTKGEDGNFYVYDFFSRRENVRGQEVDFVYINDHVTGETISAGFTTRMGINWKSWQAFRELYCNCVDEKGVINSEYVSGYDTTIEVNCLQIAEALANKDDYILPAMEPIHVGKKCDIYDRQLPYIYYRGIAVLKRDDTAFTYNIKAHLDLTEDRTVKYDWYATEYIRDEIQATESEKIVEVVNQADCFERTISLNSNVATSQTFLKVCERLQKSDKGISESSRSLLKAKIIQDRNFPEFKLNEVQQQMEVKAKALLMLMDMAIDEYPIKYVTGLGDGVMGRALDGVIYISEMPFNMGTKQLASTLMEEWVHLKTGCADFDRRMQNWLFDKILSLGESISGEPI